MFAKISAQKEKLKLDFLVILLWSLFSITLGFFLSDEFVLYRALPIGAFVIIPQVIYLALRKKKNWAKILVGTLVFGLLAGYILEFVAFEYSLWNCVSIVFTEKIHGGFTYDCVIGYALMTIYMLVFYEHFLDRDISHKVSKNIFVALVPFLLVSVFLYIYKWTSDGFPYSEYPYLVIGIIAIIPLIYLIIKRPIVFRKVSVIAVYFFFFYLYFEILAVTKSYWIYEGNNYIGWVELFNLRFPFEEMFFWMGLYAASVVSYYEIFIDDGK